MKSCRTAADDVVYSLTSTRQWSSYVLIVKHLTIRPVFRYRCRMFGLNSRRVTPQSGGINLHRRLGD